MSDTHLSPPPLSTPARPAPRLSVWLVWLLVIGLGWWTGQHLMQIDYNPSGGSQDDFSRYHLVTVRQFIALPWSQFLREMDTASGPTLYALLGLLHLQDAGPARAAVWSLHLASTALLWHLGRHQHHLSRLAASALALAFFASPFQIGPALWAHPETLGMLTMLVALHPMARSGQALLLALSVTVRQTSIAIVAAQVLQEVQLRRWRAAILQSALALAVVGLLLGAWGGLTPPRFGHHLQPSTRSLLVAATLLSLALLAGSSRWPGGRIAARRLLLIAPVVVGLYALSPAFTLGGFVFSRLDAIEARHLGGPVALASPLLLSLALTWCWDAARAHRLLALQVGVCATVLASSSILYVKYVDYFYWPLLCMALAVSQDARRRLNLVRSAVVWTLVHLVLFTMIPR